MAKAFSCSGEERAAALYCFERSDCSGGHRRDDELGGCHVLFHTVGFDEVIGGWVAPGFCLDLPDIVQMTLGLRHCASQFHGPVLRSLAPASLAATVPIAFNCSTWRNRVSLPCCHPLPSRAILM